MKQREFSIRWGMVIDLDKCTGCGACTVSCQAENNIAPVTDASNKVRTLSWMWVYQLSNGKKFPEHDTAYLPRPCQQCGHPSCVPVCPVIATERNEEGGIISQVYPRCIGCRYCMAACPYHVRLFNWFDPQWPEGMDKNLTPFTSTRPRGVVEKCTFCHHRWNNARERARMEGEDPYNMPEDWYVPACVEACPSGAMVFGDLKNPDHKVHQIIHDPANEKHLGRLLAKLHTDPAVYYMSKRQWVLNQLDNQHGESAHGGGNGGGGAHG